jgi:hypothetical protein
VAFPDLTPFNWSDAPSTTTPITAANLEDQQTHVYDALVDDVATKIHEAAPSIEYWGASPSATAAANTTAIQAAVNASNKVVVPAGKTYNINARITVPTDTTIQLDGNVTAVAGTWPAETGSASARGMFYFAQTGDEGNNGGMVGRGTLNCAGLARYGVDVDSWDNITFGQFTIENPVDAHMHFRPGSARPDGAGTGVDCDACDISHMNLGYSGTPTFPPRGILMRNAGGNDSEIRNCKMNGFEAQNPLGDVDTGGWGIEIRNGGRVKIVSNYIGDNNRKIAGAVLIRTDTDSGVPRDRSCVIRDLYVEAGLSATPPSADWIFTCVKVSVAAGITTVGSKEHTIDGLQFQSGNSSAAAKMRRLWLANSGSSGQISGVKYINPRDHLTALGQILISNGANNNLIELMGAETAFVDNGNGGTGNQIRNVLSDTY